MQVFLACFDISDDRLRRKTGRRLEHFGSRVQRSVFEVSVKSEIELNKLKEELQQWIEPGDDLRFYLLCKSCQKKSHTVFDERIAHFPAAIVV